jgi:DNA-3-methyladenine glycosylase II
VARHGAPPLWDRPPGFETLVQIILEQQISLSAGRAAYGRLERLAGAVTPERVAALSEADLRGAGLTRQKSAYIRDIARAIVEGDFDPESLAALDDDEARAALIKLRGVGAWTANIYLLMALGRADIWPSGDLALVAAIREVKRMRSLPSSDRIGRITRAWSPWRAVAARVLWHHYLSTPRQRAKVSAAKPSSGQTPAPSRRPAPKGPRSGGRSTKPVRARAAGASSRSRARMPRGGRTRV